jgi:hypothetical protein
MIAAVCKWFENCFSFVPNEKFLAGTAEQHWQTRNPRLGQPSNIGKREILGWDSRATLQTRNSRLGQPSNIAKREILGWDSRATLPRQRTSKCQLLEDPIRVAHSICSIG